MSEKISIVKRNVKYTRLEVDLNGVKLIVPKSVEVEEKEILQRHQRWLQNKVQRLNEIKEISANLKIYNHKHLNKLVNFYVEKIGRILKLKPNKIIFRKMKVRWGSCHHEKGIIIFNKFLKYLPKELISYVVLHEMCHLIVKNHKKEFWLLVKKLDPNFKEKEKLLAGYRVRLNLI
jgi:predicted metal-dependent hydrolase